MSWQDVHRYYAALHQVEDDLDRTGDGVLLWRPEYEEIFGSPRRLHLALRSYWRNMIRAQVEWDDDRNWRRIHAAQQLAAAHPGLARAARGEGEPARPDAELVGAA
jgi:hypothetical protein